MHLCAGRGLLTANGFHVVVLTSDLAGGIPSLHDLPEEAALRFTVGDCEGRADTVPPPDGATTRGRLRSAELATADEFRPYDLVARFEERCAIKVAKCPSFLGLRVKSKG